MAPRPRTSPRKLPTQGRSKATVEAILAATAKVLTKDGYEGASTNRVAKVAGVSVGSLYQYFPSKEALVAAVIERHVQEIYELLAVKLVELADTPIQVMARQLVRTMFQMHAHEPQLHRVLIEQVPRVGRLTRLQELDRRMEALLVEYMRSRRDQLMTEDLELTAFLLVTLVKSVSHAKVLEGREFSTDQVADEVSRVILRYLLPLEEHRAEGKRGMHRSA